MQLNFSKKLTVSTVQHKLLIGATISEIPNFLCFLSLSVMSSSCSVHTSGKGALLMASKLCKVLQITTLVKKF